MKFKSSFASLKGGLGFAFDVRNGSAALRLAVSSAASVRLTWNNSYSTRAELVQSKTKLPDVAWTNRGWPIAVSGATDAFTETPAAWTTRFYRVGSQ